MRHSLTALATLLLIGGGLAGPALARPAASPAASTAPLTFDQFRDREMARLQHAKERIDRLAALSPADQEQRLRKRFDRLDANHDGAISADEIAAFRAAHHRHRGGGNETSPPRQQ